MELAARIYKPLYVYVAAIETKTDQRIVVVELRIAGDYNSWLKRIIDVLT